MQACPGYAEYEVLDSMEIAVAGGVPVYAEGSAQHAKIASMWERYGDLVLQAAARNGFPPAWFMGIMHVESGGDPNACSPCEASVCSFAPNCGGPCCAYGLMQMIGLTAKLYGTTGQALLGDAELAIEKAAEMLADLMYSEQEREAQGFDRKAVGGKRAPFGADLVRIAAAYNAGAPRCSGQGTFGLTGQHDYSMKAVLGANTAIAMGVPVAAAAAQAGMGTGLWLVALGAAGYFGWRWLQRRRR